MSENLENPTKKESNLLKEIEDHGYILWRCRGASMEPLIDSDTDMILIRRIDGDIRPWDVAMYTKSKQAERENSGDYILHRVIENKGDHCIILGDNCTDLEYVSMDRIVGVMGDRIRGGESLDTGSYKYRAYMGLWVKPWRARIRAIKVKRQLRRAWWKSVAILSPYTPEPVKKCIKSLIIR